MSSQIQMGEHLVFDAKDYNLEKTLDSGQNVRAVKQADGFYRIMSGRQIAKVRQENPEAPVEIYAGSKDAMLYWTYFLSLYEQPPVLDDLTSGNKFLRNAVQFSKGIRLMHTDPWESLITFIISQRNSISRILTTVEKLCKVAGSPAGYGLYYFPTPQEILSINLSGIGAGYRLSYILSAASAVENDEIHLESLQAGLCSSTLAMQELTRLPGVGSKVASCICLFGLGHRDVFPVDVWIERAMQEGNITSEDVVRFGDRAGLLQQYIYYYMLNRERLH